MSGHGVAVSWNGMPGHFIDAANCAYHLHTIVGEFFVSTVGLWFPDPRAHHRRAGRPRALGGVSNELFETMVFRLAGEGEFEMVRYASSQEADHGHALMVARYVSLQQEDDG
jgi:hypothetical protein